MAKGDTAIPQDRDTKSGKQEHFKKKHEEVSFIRSVNQQGRACSKIAK